MARGGTPSADYKFTVWNFHRERFTCPACGRKGVTENRHGFTCQYKRLGCGKTFKSLNNG